MDLGLAGRTAVVTGASRGLGRAIVLALVAEGVRVAAVARSARELEALAGESRDGLVHPLECDLSDPAALEPLMASARAALGGLDVLVNNAGIAPAGPFIDQDPAQWDQIFRVNVAAPATLARHAGRIFLAQKSGKVINVASTAGLRGKPVLAAYSASKAALIRFTEALAAEWARDGVQVNAIAPGAFRTDAQRAVLDDPEVLARRVRKIPAGRIADAGEIGPLACFLASPLSDFVTGTTVVMDGGEVSRL
jgi:2-deoxy-D-gluconate 3-dehydrogenase